MRLIACLFPVAFAFSMLACEAAFAPPAPFCGSCAISPPGPEQECVRACVARAARCSRRQCVRGCNFILDRLTEHEGKRVVACVSDAQRSQCDDATWAHCATLVGPYADGGPPAPPPPRDTFDEDP